MNAIEEKLLQTAAARQWREIGVQRKHGIAVPLFSIHTQHSCGIGEFFDLFPLIIWCRKMGLTVIQLLPLNDIGPDFSPYNAISAYALNPLFISLSKLSYLDESNDLQRQLQEMQGLNKFKKVQYPKVKEAKDHFLRDYYNLFFTRYSQSDDYKRFVYSNDWLTGYALFKTIKEERNWHSWFEWEEPLRNINAHFLDELSKSYHVKINFHIFLQYLAHSQMKEVKKYANQNQILIKGDIPILISRESSDVWLNKDLFHIEYSAGAPPDMLGPEGQNWGFPIYNWKAIENNNFVWWRKRLMIHNDLYNLYRLDHIVGFYRIWAIPNGAEGKDGHFVPVDHMTWISQGDKILKMMLETSSMLPIGEDLGTVPPEVRANLRDLGICGTKVMRWERKWHETDQPFIPYNQYIPESMTTVSTHDSETLQLWWKNNPEEVKKFCQFKQWDYQIDLSKERHREILRDSHHTSSLFHINLLQEYLFLVPNLTWENPEDERINVPGIVSENNWSYRYKPNMETLTENKEIQEIFQAVLH